MKPIKQTLMSGAMILALSLAFTSCEDILGTWDKPAPAVVTPSEPETPSETPAATITTAPTATADVKAGSTTELVTAGVADGGTVMYKVTNDNTKPTSTDGFDATVPTAATLAAGTFYVWYYAKADATHSDSEISATAITVTVAYALLSAATTADHGKVVCAAGHLHAAKTAVPTGCTAVGILGKVTSTGHGLILALKDATGQTWPTINGWTSETTYAGTTLKVLPDDAARGPNLTGYTTLGATAVSNWAVAQISDYEAIFTNLGSTKATVNGHTHDANVNAYITTGVGGSEFSTTANYWTATSDSNPSYAWAISPAMLYAASKGYSRYVRPVLGF